MKKVELMVFAVVIAVSLIGSANAMAQKRFEGVTLHLPTLAGWRCPAVAWEREKEFAKKTGAEFVVEEIPQLEYDSKLMFSLVGHTGTYDLITGNPPSQVMFEPYLMSLNDFVKRDFGSVDNFLDMFYDSTAKYVTYDGEVKYVPYHLNAQYMAYRKELFNNPVEKAAFKAKYGYELQAPKTYQQVIDIGKFFTRPEENMWGLLVMGKGPPGGWNIMFGLYGAGLSFVDLKTKKAPFAAPGAAREKAIKEAKFWYDLVHKYKVIPPGASAIGFTEWYEMYARGQGAMFYGWVGDWYDRITSPEIVAKIGESGTSVRPTQIPEGTYYTSMWGYGIPKTCKNPEAAWALIKWLISEDIQLAMSRESGQASPLVKYTEKAIEKGWVAEALRTELKRGRLPQKFIQCPAVVSLYWTYASELYAGGLTPEEFVDKIAKETEKIMR